jgi:lipid-A-disaccharide synthase
MRVLLVAGEASGDAHAARVAACLRRQGAHVLAVGGPALQAAGVELVAHIDELAVLGFVEVVGRLPRFLALERRLAAMLRGGRFDLLLSVDFPGFNLRLGRRAHAAGVPVLHYIGPQVWAWRAGRLETLRRCATHVALILPFEKPLYDARGIPATFVGHPLLDDGEPAAVEPDRDLGLFPGSRRQEIERHLPLLLAAAAEVRRRRPSLSVVLSRAATVPRQRLRELVAAHGFDPESDLDERPARVVLRRCRASLVASGTATLEAALAERPFAVLYRTGRVNYELVRRMVHLPYVSLANLVAGQEVVREYLQQAASPPRLAAEAERLLDDGDERRRQVDCLRAVRQRLGTPGAAERVAHLAVDVVRRARGVHAT